MATEIKGNPLRRLIPTFGRGKGIDDCSLHTDCLNQGADSIGFGGYDVCLYGILRWNENTDGHRIGGTAFLASGGDLLGCAH